MVRALLAVTTPGENAGVWSGDVEGNITVWNVAEVRPEKQPHIEFLEGLSCMCLVQGSVIRLQYSPNYRVYVCERLWLCRFGLDWNAKGCRHRPTSTLGVGLLVMSVRCSR
jgi:hypothetical protein